jgi:hypothetical protein
VREALVEQLTGVDGAQAVREHLEQCAHCQQLIHMYASLDILLRSEMQAPFGDWSHARSISSPHAPWEQQDGETSSATAPSHVKWIFSRRMRPVSVQKRDGSSEPSREPLRLARFARWLPGVAALVVVVLLGQAIFSGFEAFMPDANHTPAPKWFSWTPSATANENENPQVVFADSAHLTMCKQQPALTMQTTWIVASQTLGVALIEADCGSLGQPVALTVIGRDATGSQGCQSWRSLGGVYFGHRPSADFAPIADAAGRIPSWVHLPQRGYTVGALGARTSPQFSLAFWLFSNQEMIVGRFQGTVERPSSAATVMVNGRPGWIETSGRETVIFVPQVGNETFVLAGSVRATELQALATQIFPRLSEITPKPLDGSALSPSC